MALDLVGVRVARFDAEGPPLRRSALAGLLLAVALPVPLVSASGLSFPLPGFVERMAVALADGVARQNQTDAPPSSRGVTIALTVAERALAKRVAVTPAPTPTPTRAAVHHSVARASLVAVSPVRRSEPTAASTRRVAFPAVAPAAVVDSATQANEVTTPRVSPAVDPVRSPTPTVSIVPDTRVVDVAVDPVPVVPVVPVVTVDVDPVAVAPVVTVDPDERGSSNAGGNSGSGGTSDHGNSGSGSTSDHGKSGSSNSGDNSGPGNGSGSGRGKAGTTAGSE